jgi:hypothetical protein
MDSFWFISLILTSLIVGISLTVLGIVIVIKKRRIKILLIGIGLVFITLFLPRLMFYLEQKNNEKKLVGSYMLEDTITNTILKLSDDLTFEFKKIDTIHKFGNGTWKWRAGDNAPCIELTFLKPKNAIVLFSIRHKYNSEEIFLVQLSNKNRITLIKK